MSINCLTWIDELLDIYPNLNIRLLWLPRNIPSVGFKRTKQLALEAICTAKLKEDDEPHLIKAQKKKTTETAILMWAEHWHQAPQSSLAYRTALTKPPDGRLYPIFFVWQNTVKFSCLTICTLYRIITRHTFIGSYTQRFFPQHTQEQIACPCGEPVQTVEHILLHCQLHNTAHCKHLTASGHP